MGGKSLEPNPVPVILKLEREKTRLFVALSSPSDANKTCQLFVDGQKIDVNEFRQLFLISFVIRPSTVNKTLCSYSAPVSLARS